MISERLAALDASIHAVPAEDDEYAELVLENERGSRPFSVAGAEAAKSLMAALPALVALVAAAESLEDNAFVMVEHRMGDGARVAGLPMPELDAVFDALAALDEALA